MVTSTMSPSGFLSRDPIGFKGSEWNLYEYCESCPLVNLDPSGEAIWVPIGCAAACVACGLCMYDWPDHWLPSAFCSASCGVCGVCLCKIKGLGKPKGAPPKSKPRKEPNDVDEWEKREKKNQEKRGRPYYPDNQPPRKPNIPDHKKPPVDKDPFNPPMSPFT